MNRSYLLAALGALGLTVVAHGQTQPAPATGPAAAQQPAPNAAPEATMKIDVVEVKGLVQVRTAEGQPWMKAAVGMVLDQGAEFRTGPRSSVTCQIPPDQTITLDRLGTVKIAEAIRNGNKVKTDMIMKYGRTKYDIEAAGAEHESTIRSPGSTLAVRGTFVSLYDQPPFAPVAESFHGQAEFRDAHRELRFGGKTPTVIAADKNSVAETALAKSTIDPVSAQSRTRSEQKYISDQASRSAIFGFDLDAGIPTIRDGPPPPTDAQLVAGASSLPGTLDVVLRWQGNGDVNLEVQNTAGTNGEQLLTTAQTKTTEFLYPGYGLNHTPSGGTIPYNNLGGPNGGMEIAYWKGNNYPKGLYGASALLISGGPVLATLNIFLNGKELGNLETFEVDSQGHLVTEPTSIDGFPTTPILVYNSQITRPLSLTAKPNANDLYFASHGPNYFKEATVTSFIPPSLENDIPVQAPPYDVFNPVPEPPVSFPPPDSGKSKSSQSSRSAKTAQITQPVAAGIPRDIAPAQSRPDGEKSPRTR